MKDLIALQKDLDTLVEWGKKWAMTFNVTKWLHLENL